MVEVLAQVGDEARRAVNRTAADNTGFDVLSKKLRDGTLTGNDLALPQGVLGAAKNNLTSMQQNQVTVSAAG